MIRVALCAIGFLVVTITLIIMHPSEVPFQSAQIQPDDTASVTRADTGLGALTNITATRADLPQNAQVSGETGTPQDHQTPSVADVPTPVGDGLEALIVEALRQGQSDAYIDALVNDAAEKGRVEVPDTLVTNDGRIDTTTLLATLSSDPNHARPNVQVYTVRPGDSLASIAFRFYGATARAPEIFAINKDLMGSPRNIAVGQELIIPIP